MQKLECKSPIQSATHLTGVQGNVRKQTQNRQTQGKNPTHTFFQETHLFIAWIGGGGAQDSLAQA